MNPHFKNLNRIEFIITVACTGKCRHCSQGEHAAKSEHIDGDVAAGVVRSLCGKYNMESLMTFGGEPLLYADQVFKIHTAWLVDADNVNPYNQRTKEILAEFEQMGIAASKGNNIFPRGNALKYLSEYFDMSREYVNPYDQDPEDVRAICVNANGDIDVLAGNVYREDILDMIG